MSDTTTIQVKVASESGRNVVDAFQLCKRIGQRPVLPLETLRHSAVSLVTARRSDVAPDSPLLATAGIFRPVIRCFQDRIDPRLLDIFVLDGLHEAPGVSGFEPSLMRSLLAVAISEIAWVHASDDERETCVIALTSHDNFALRAELMCLRAVQIPVPTWLEVIIGGEADSAMSRPEAWLVSVDAAARAITYLLRLPPFSAASRHTFTASTRKLSLALDLPWLHLARDYLRSISTGVDRLTWEEAPKHGLSSIAGGKTWRGYGR